MIYRFNGRGIDEHVGGHTELVSSQRRPKISRLSDEETIGVETVICYRQVSRRENEPIAVDLREHIVANVNRHGDRMTGVDFEVVIDSRSNVGR